MDLNCLYTSLVHLNSDPVVAISYSNLFLYKADYQKKIDVCKKKTEEAKSEVAADAEIDLLQKELEVEIEKENLLMDELR